METVSENNERRGRPRKYEVRKGDTYLDEFLRYESDPRRGINEKVIFTTRQQQNIILAERATDRIQETREDMLDSDLLSYIPQRVLTELGRIEDEAFFRRVLGWYLDEWGIRYRDATRTSKLIRDLRLGRRVFRES
jgi:hypothetical protein